MLLKILILVFFCQSSIYANENNHVSWPHSLKETQWNFTPKNTTTPIPINAGTFLPQQLKNIAPCCSGKYQAEIDLKFLQKLDETSKTNLGILLSPTGGLKSVEINHHLILMPDFDYSSAGPIINIPENMIAQGKMQLSLNIESDLSNYAGMWRKFPIVDSIQKLTSIRDDLHVFQVIIPIFFSLVFAVLSLVFLLVSVRSKNRNNLYIEYFYGLISWSVFYLFLSGFIRSKNAYWGSLLHQPFRSLAGLASFRIISTYAGIDKKRTNQLSLLVFTVLVFSTIFSIYEYHEMTYIVILYIINLMSIPPLLMIFKRNKSFIDQLFLLTSLFSILSGLIDETHLVFAQFMTPFPLPYMNRYTTPPFLFMSIVYLGINLLDEITKTQKSKAIEEVSAQVAHDIRSPLSALEVISSSLNELPENKRSIIRNSINRIRDITNSLQMNKKSFLSLNKNEPSITVKSDEFTSTLLEPFIDLIVSEKRIQYRSKIETRIEFDQSKDSYGLFAMIRAIEFQRVISNLIDNSVQAFIDDIGVLEVILKAGISDQIEIIIKDNGRGIPANILPKLFVRGETYGKPQGSGLGLYHASETIKAFGGTISIESQIDIGTTVTIKLPKAKEPNWFVPKIKLSSNHLIVVIDDDQSIHQIWKGRMGSMPSNETIKFVHFSSPVEFKKFYGKNFIDFDSALFLVDFEMAGFKESGLDIIETLGIEKQSILVTSRYEEKAIRDRCKRLGIHLIPKNMSGFVPIEITDLV